jgi:hypothetical protein
MIFGGSGWWIGAAVLVLGILTTRALRREATGVDIPEGRQPSQAAPVPGDAQSADVVSVDGNY